MPKEGMGPRGGCISRRGAEKIGPKVKKWKEGGGKFRGGFPREIDQKGAKRKGLKKRGVSAQ